MGDLVLALYPDVAPQHVAQLLRLVRLGVYDQALFSRVFPGYLVEIGDVRSRPVPLTPEQQAAIHRLNAEADPMLQPRRGIVTMARHGSDPNSAETSFAILLGDAPQLQGTYTIFGRLERGDDVLDAIAVSGVDAEHRPLTPIIIERAEVAASPEMLTGMRLRDAVVPVPKRPPTAAGLLFPWLCGALLLFGLAEFMLAKRASAGVLRAHGLLAVLVGFFFLYAAFVPQAIGQPWPAVVLFAASLGLFKLMSYFEGRS